LVDSQAEGSFEGREILKLATPNSLRSMRDTANNMFLDILLYTSPRYKHRISEAVARLLNAKVSPDSKPPLHPKP
jgi:hypothetical protein